MLCAKGWILAEMKYYPVTTIANTWRSGGNLFTLEFINMQFKTKIVIFGVFIKHIWFHIIRTYLQRNRELRN
jgi:hypothetical protein